MKGALAPSISLCYPEEGDASENPSGGAPRMTIQVDRPGHLEARLREEAAQQGQDAAEYISELVKRQLVMKELEALRKRKPPQTLADLKPRLPTPSGTMWLEAIRGQWPGDESDEEIERILKEIS